MARKNRIFIATACAVLVGGLIAMPTDKPAAEEYPQEILSVEVVHTTYQPQTVEEMICMECDKYDIDAQLAMAIARLETGNFTSEVFTELHNVGGMSRDEEPIGFVSLERGVEAFVKNLYHNYYLHDLDTVEEIAEKYCPVNAEQWAESVNAIMNE